MDGQIEAFSAGRRDCVGGITGEKEIAVAHGGLHEAAEGQDHLADYRTLFEFKAVAVDPAAQLGPNPVVIPTRLRPPWDRTGSTYVALFQSVG